MRGERFFGTGAVLIVCVLFLTAEFGLVSVARAKGKPPKTTPSYGYAELTDGEAYVIWTDVDENGEPKGEYIDVNIPGAGGEDQIEIETDDDGIVKSGVVLGRIDQPSCSSRRVLFKFDINACERIVESPKAVLDILLGSAGILEAGAVHLAVMYWRSDGVVDYVAFIVDPGCDGIIAEGAITQEAVDSFDENDTDENYRTSIHGHVIYYLGYPDYPNPVCIEPVPDNGNGWTVTCSSGPVTLYVMRTVGKGKSKGGAYEKLELATYQSIPFKLTMWLDGQGAPRKHCNLSTTWGEVKGRFSPGIRE